MPLAARRVARRGVVGPAPVARTAAVVGTAAVVAHGVDRRSDRREDRRDRPLDAWPADSAARFEEDAMSQSHLVIDFPIKAPANAKALTEELPPLMPDLAKVQDDLGTVHFSRFMVEGDEKLLFVSDIDGEGAPHIERLVERAGPRVRRHLRTRGRRSRDARDRQS